MRHCQAAGALAGAASEPGGGGGGCACEPAGGTWGTTTPGIGAAGAGCGCGSREAVVAAFAGSGGCAFLGAACLRTGFQAENGHPSWADVGCSDAASNSAQPASTILMPLPPSCNHSGPNCFTFG